MLKKVTATIIPPGGANEILLQTPPGGVPGDRSVTSRGNLGPDPRKSGDWVVTPPGGGGDSITVAPPGGTAGGG